MITPDRALKMLEAIKASKGDMESDHVQADNVLCELLRSLGHEEVVDAYDKISKRYA